MDVSAQALINRLILSIQEFTDTRTGVNQRFSMVDVGLGAFSTFFLQFPSFLSRQKVMEERLGKNNAKSLFSIHAIPTDNHIRDMLDSVSPQQVTPVFQWCFDQLLQTGEMKHFKSELGYLVALDGTQYFSSDRVSCKNCLTKTEKKTGRLTNYHTALTPVIVKPGNSHVFSLVPEFIIPQDGHEKQDCENAASKRWLRAYGKQLASLNDAENKTTILGDDLYSRQPLIEVIQEQNLRFILVCKRESHKWLYDWIDNLDIGAETESMHTITARKWNGKSHLITTYRYANHVPLRDSGDTLFVNWCEVTITNEETGKPVYHNAFITNHQVTSSNVALIVLCGRTRWKIENENNNVLKTKGYHFEHNYGHGKQYLSSLLTSLILIAFLFHTLLDLFSAPYRIIKNKLPSREIFFHHLQAVTSYLYFISWEHLFAFMIKGIDDPYPAALFTSG